MNSYSELILREKFGVHPESLICYECGNSEITKTTHGIYCSLCRFFKYYRRLNR